MCVCERERERERGPSDFGELVVAVICGYSGGIVVCGRIVVAAVWGCAEMWIAFV